jgi:hypothetical protein
MHITSCSIRRRVVACVPVLVMLVCAAITPDAGFAQGPKGRSFGFGFSLGEPAAFTTRWWTSKKNSWDAAIGVSHLGNPHIHADYLWHFPDAFNSNIVSLYAGIGGIVGFGERGKWFGIGNRKYKDDDWYYGDDHAVIAVKGVFALNIIPRNTPLDIFLEIDPVLGISPGFGFDFQPAIGIRFYP